MDKQAGTGTISDDAVKNATGRTWDEWFTLLDRENAATMNHTDLARHIHTVHGVSGWWSQSVTGAYERARGRRQKHEMPDGFKVSISRVVNAPVAVLYHAWVTPPERDLWLDEAALDITSTREFKSVRARWHDNTRIAVSLYSKGEHKSQVVVEHSKLKDAGSAGRCKEEWTKRLEALKTFLET